MRRFIGAVAAVVAIAACKSSPPGASTQAPLPAGLPAALDAGPGLRATLGLRAAGTQNYACRVADGGSAAWSPAVPEAKLFDSDGGLVGRHFAGPTWQWTADQSCFVGDKARVLAVPSPDGASAHIPWLLVPRKGGSDGGVLGPVRVVERIQTAGGLVTAQDAGCTAAAADGGLVVKVPYRATYVFFEAVP